MSSDPAALPSGWKAGPDSVLFVTLDSCRYDTFEAADAPALKAVSRLFRAEAPAHFTYGSHLAMFAGFTPGIARMRAPYLNPKFARLFRLARAGAPGHAPSGFDVEGDDIVSGFRNRGHLTVGSGAMRWFDPETPVSRKLTAGFDRFTYVGPHGDLARQVRWATDQLAEADGREVFLFLNVGETHAPYHHAGAPWEATDNPCRPFQEVDRSAECRVRQRACCEFADRHLAPLLAAFRDSTILLCADHGDCWGEDGLWEHGVSHAMTLTVPLLLRYRGVPIEAHLGLGAD